MRRLPVAGGTFLAQPCVPEPANDLNGDVSFTTIDVPGATQICAYGINDLGYIVGSFTDSAGTHGFLASPDDGTGEGGFLGIGTRR